MRKRFLHILVAIIFSISCCFCFTGCAILDYIKGLINSNQEIIRIEPGKGIGYCLPTFTHYENLNETTLKFRVTKPYKNVSLNVLVNGKSIKKIKQFISTSTEILRKRKAYANW